MAKDPAQDDAASDDSEPILGKGRATPSRKEREAARKRPLVPNDRKEAARQSRAESAVARERARIGLAMGDERYLPMRDRGQQRRYVRDYVDARLGAGELFLPIMLIVIVLTYIPDKNFATVGLLLFVTFFVVAVLDCLLMSIFVRKRIAKKFGDSAVERGIKLYAVMRSLQLRVMRLPKPQVRRRQFPS